MMQPLSIKDLDGWNFRKQTIKGCSMISSNKQVTVICATFCPYPLFFRVHKAQPKVVLLSQVKLLADMVNQPLALCVFLQQQNRVLHKMNHAQPVIRGH